jgi:hypothetical protein
LVFEFVSDFVLRISDFTTMYRIVLPLTDYRLLLAPRWGELPAGVQAILTATVCLVPIALLVALYRYELRLVRRGVAVGLLTLRLGVLAYLLFILCWQPILAWTPVEALPSRVLIAVDRSDSTNAADPQRSTLDKLLLARALHLASDLCSDRELDGWIRAYQEGKTPQWVGREEFPEEAGSRQQLAEARRRQHDQVCRRIDNMTRSQIAQKLLAGDGGRLLQSLTGKHPIDLLGFAQDTWDVPALSLDELFLMGAREGEAPAEPLVPVARQASRPPGSTAEPRSINFESSTDFTDLNQPLDQALKRSGPGRGKIAGVILLSDGQHNRGPSPALKAEELNKWKIPIYPVALGDPLPPPDVALVKVEAPTTVLKDTVVPIDAQFQVTGLPKQDIVITLERQDEPAGQPLLQERILHHPGKDGPASPIRFEVRLDKPGTHALVVKARPVPGEARTDNNGRTVVIRVEDDNKTKVLLIDGEARWEYHYLANALSRDPTVALERILLKPPLLNPDISDEILKQMGNPKRTLPAEPDAFNFYDCIVLGDLTPEELSVADRKRLEKYVADHGGTLVLVAGKRALPLAYLSEPAQADDPLVRLLPLEEAHVVSPLNGFAVTLTRAGKGTKFLQLEATREESEKRWFDLPPQYWGVVGRAKPAANPLAYFRDGDEISPSPPGGEGPGVRGRDTEEKQSREQSLFALQNFGLGRVLYLGLNSTWRWRYRVGDVYHHRFWSQIIRWAASDKPQTQFGTRAPVYAHGDPVDVFVKLEEEAIRNFPGRIEIDARILRLGAGGEKLAAVVHLTGDARQQILEKQVTNLPPGNYAVELAIADPQLAEKLLGKRTPQDKKRVNFTVTPPDSAERTRLEANWDLLRELADKSGGRFLKVEQADQLLDLLAQQIDTSVQGSEFKLWQSWTTLIVILLLLTLEWVSRKLAGLP